VRICDQSDINNYRIQWTPQITVEGTVGATTCSACYDQTFAGTYVAWQGLSSKLKKRVWGAGNARRVFSSAFHIPFPFNKHLHS
jgi:hypothetical protein